VPSLDLFAALADHPAHTVGKLPSQTDKWRIQDLDTDPTYANVVHCKVAGIKKSDQTPNVKHPSRKPPASCSDDIQ
jgi:hypothetical protein